jgi:hypothetical protein
VKQEAVALACDALFLGCAEKKGSGPKIYCMGLWGDLTIKTEHCLFIIVKFVR